MTTIIKRYANRKLYDTEQSSYVTLDEIQKMVEEGRDIRIIDNKSKEDLTNATLAQIIFEQEKSHKRMLPLSALRLIIQSGEDFIDKIQNPVNQFRDELKHRASKLEEGGRAVVDFVETTQRSLDEMQRKVDDRLKDAVDQMTHVPDMRRELVQLDKRLQELEQSVKRIERIVVEMSPERIPTARDPRRDIPNSR